MPIIYIIEEVQLVTVKQNWLAIKYIKNPSEEVQLAAVKQYWGAIEYIENPSEEVKKYVESNYEYEDYDEN